MIRTISWLLGASALVAHAADPIELRPAFQGRHIITPAEVAPGVVRYLAFPTVTVISADEIWVAYKAGEHHADDPGAGIEIVSHRLSSGATRLIQRLQPRAPKLYQMAEMVRLPDGTLGVYIDVQETGLDGHHYRTGAESYRWDGVRGVLAGPAKLAPIEGVTYGYPFDFIVRDRTTWQLIMSFGYLPGGRWSVDVVRSDDAGGSWRFVRNLREEFGNIPANESAFVPYHAGYIVATRGYDSHARLHRTDADFHLQRETDLTAQCPFVKSYIGRPRLFVRDGQGYLIGRNWTHTAATPTMRGPGAPMQLCLLRFDLESLVVTACAILDNAEDANVTDGYYAEPILSEHDGRTWLHVITYKAKNQGPPDIVRFDYHWDEVK